jgi:hypothetical protein
MTVSTMPAPMHWDSVAISEEPGGYAVSETHRGNPVARVTETTLRLLAGTAFVSAFLVWLTPVPGPAQAAIGLQLMMSVLLLTGSLGFYWLAARGFRQVVQLNIRRRELRLGRINHAGRVRTFDRFALDQIDSIFVQRPVHGGAAVLCLRIGHASSNIPLLQGDPTELGALHRRLCEDMRAPAECMPRRLPGIRPAITPRPGRRSRNPVDGVLAAE